MPASSAASRLDTRYAAETPEGIALSCDRPAWCRASMPTRSTS